jgi:hypothetical protein
MHQALYFIRPGCHAAEEASRFGLAGASAEMSTGRHLAFSRVINCSGLSDPPSTSVLIFFYLEVYSLALNL